MRVLVACEYSGTVREAFAKLGHIAVSCDLLPTEIPSQYHYQGDILHILERSEWDLMIAHPPCTYLASSGLHWNNKIAGRQEKTEAALAFVQALMDAQIDKICIENPIGRINTAIRKPDQYIQPYEYGHDASKKTGLWLKGLPHLQPTGRVEPRRVKGKNRWANQTDSGQNVLTPSPDRWKLRSKTYHGWAEAMATQWGAG